MHHDAFGLFQDSDEFPDDLAQALQRVAEKMFRAGYRDWEAEWDYVDPGYWFLRRDLEVNARETFRNWYGEGQWQAPFRMACHLQVTGGIEYRIDHLIQSSLGVEVRRQPKARTAGAPTLARRVCSVGGCGGLHLAKGYCQKHYERARKYGDPLKSLAGRDGTKVCTTPGCGRKHYAKGLCGRCYWRAYRARKEG